MTVPMTGLQNRVIFIFPTEEKRSQVNTKQLIPSKLSVFTKSSISWSEFFLSSTFPQNPRASVQTFHILRWLLEIKWPTENEKCNFLVMCHYQKSTVPCVVQTFGWNLQNSSLAHDNCWFSLCHPHYLKGLLFSVSSKHNWTMLWLNFDQVFLMGSQRKTVFD